MTGGHYCKRAARRAYPDGCTMQCGECGAWEALQLHAEYEAKQSAVPQDLARSRTTEPYMQTDPEPHEGHRACQKRFAGDAHTIANMGGMLNEAEALLRDWLAQTNATLGDTIQRTYKWGRRWAEMRDAHLPKSSMPEINCLKHGLIGSPDGSCPKCAQ